MAGQVSQAFLPLCAPWPPAHPHLCICRGWATFPFYSLAWRAPTHASRWRQDPFVKPSFVFPPLSLPPLWLGFSEAFCIHLSDRQSCSTGQDIGSHLPVVSLASLLHKKATLVALHGVRLSGDSLRLYSEVCLRSPYFLSLPVSGGPSVRPVWTG